MVGDYSTVPLPHEDDVDPIVEACRPHLAGRHPALQGAALADLVSLWIAGHPEELREVMLAQFLETVRELVPNNVTLLRDRPS